MTIPRREGPIPTDQRMPRECRIARFLTKPAAGGNVRPWIRQGLLSTSRGKFMLGIVLDSAKSSIARDPMCNRTGNQAGQ